MTNKALGKLKAFGMTNQMVVEDLSRIGKLFAVELGHLPTTAQGQEDVYYPQFEAAGAGRSCGNEQALRDLLLS